VDKLYRGKTQIYALKVAFSSSYFWRPAAVQFRALIHVSGHSVSGQILRFHAKTL
jgi:hypothetical protein